VSLMNDANSDTLASAGPFIFDQTTLRPIFGLIIYNMGHVNLSTVIYVLIHSSIVILLKTIYRQLYTKYIMVWVF